MPDSRNVSLRALALLAGMLGSALAAEVRPGSGRTATIVRQVDHVLVVSSDAAKLFTVLSDTFQLPVAWPFSVHGTFSSGGVSLGNVNLEVIQGPATAAKESNVQWTGFALEPEPLAVSVPELEARGIRHGVPAPFRQGFFRTRWTTVALPEVSGTSMGIFLCRYEDDIAARRRQLRDQLQSRGGGPLSIRAVQEVTCGARDETAMRGHWQKLLNPAAPSSEGLWKIGDGPGVHVVPADQDGILGLVISVRSVQQARQFLEPRGMAESQPSGVLRLGGPLFRGLGISLVEPTDGNR